MAPLDIPPYCTCIVCPESVYFQVIMIMSLQVESGENGCIPTVNSADTRRNVPFLLSLNKSLTNSTSAL